MSTQSMWQCFALDVDILGMQYIKELKNLGLKDKEAAVYLACLELGPSPAQQIARKANIVRATTYVVLESLMQKGIVTQYREGKKTLFSSEPPRQLIRILEKQVDDIEDKKRELEMLMPALQMIMRASGGRPSVRYFEGIEGLRSMRREMVMYSQAGDEWYNFTPIDHLSALFSRDEAYYVQQRLAKRIRSKTIFSTRSQKSKEEMFQGAGKNLQRRFVDPKLFPSSSGFTVYRDRVAIGQFKGKIGGVIIESPQMADTMRRLFELAWIAADAIDKK